MAACMDASTPVEQHRNTRRLWCWGMPRIFVGGSDAAPLVSLLMATAHHGHGAPPTGLMAGLVPGALVGARIAHRVPLKQLKLLVSAILVLAAAFLIGKLLWSELGGGKL